MPDVHKVENIHEIISQLSQNPQFNEAFSQVPDNEKTLIISALSQKIGRPLTISEEGVLGIGDTRGLETPPEVTGGILSLAGPGGLIGAFSRALGTSGGELAGQALGGNVGGFIGGVGGLALGSKLGTKALLGLRDLEAQSLPDVTRKPTRKTAQILATILMKDIHKKTLPMTAESFPGFRRQLALPAPEPGPVYTPRPGIVPPVTYQSGQGLIRPTEPGLTKLGEAPRDIASPTILHPERPPIVGGSGTTRGTSASEDFITEIAKRRQAAEQAERLAQQEKKNTVAWRKIFKETFKKNEEQLKQKGIPKQVIPKANIPDLASPGGNYYKSAEDAINAAGLFTEGQGLKP